MKAPYTMLLRLLRKTNRSPTRSGNSNAASLATRLPEDVLFAIFAVLRPIMGPRDDPWIHPDGFYAVGRHTLVSAAHVCRAWFIPATAILYRSVRLRTAKKCIAFARTLATRPQLAAAVRDVALPGDSAKLSLPLDHSRRGLQRRLNPAQRRLRAAVITIVDRCTNTTYFCIAFPASGAIFDTFQLDVLAPRLRKVTFYQRGVQERNSDSEPPSNRWYTRSAPLSAPRFVNLEVLCLSNMISYHFGSAPIRASFPALRALFLSWVHIPAADLCGLLLELGPLLETLSLYGVSVSTLNHGIWSSPLELLDDQVIPHGSMSALTDLRVLDPYPQRPITGNERLNNIHTGVSTLIKLSISTTHLKVVRVVPASLEQLVVYYDITDGSRSIALRRPSDPLLVAASLTRRLTQFKRCAPLLRTVLLRICDALLAELALWQIVSFLLHSFCRNLGLNFGTELHLNHPSIRLAIHRAEQAKRDLRIEEQDEERYLHEISSQQNGWNVPGFY
ncbi:hypothetical protein EXIGLDRAFT_844075 [Exidia glandulosa HHB12029]|uniref:F-box/LRR-repeat protein 15/At3g58940/PEG3-like LRR domain-containing protein n=1 Tax=Exidia glandulosa HHB12029 TaxID=1314781 RepID=A0A165ZEW5_EXIGL|nr:hypothetical protein EXIGLDRAFT_844075 [Exidia glandulosa HHB12029]